MRKQMEEFREMLKQGNKLSGHEDVLIAFDHLLDLVEEHETSHIEEIGRRSLNYEKANGEVEFAIREEISFMRKAAHTVIERTVLDLINKGQKTWEKFYDKVE